MRRARPLNEDEYIARISELIDLGESYRDTTGHTLDDETSINIGTLNGRLVMIDYANLPPDDISTTNA